MGLPGVKQPNRREYREQLCVFTPVADILKYDLIYLFLFNIFEIKYLSCKIKIMVIKIKKKVNYDVNEKLIKKVDSIVHKFRIGK